MRMLRFFFFVYTKDSYDGYGIHFKLLLHYSIKLWGKTGKTFISGKYIFNEFL